MAERTQVELELVALMKGAKKSVDQFTKDTQQQLSSISFSQTVTAISTSFIALRTVATDVFRAIEGTVGRAIETAARHEEAINRVSTAMALAGSYSSQASEEVQAFANEIQQTTTVSNEAALEMVALARNFTMTNEEATKLTKAAIELSAATGMSLDSALKNLGKTYAGLTGELGESLPIVKTLTVEQLKAGEALDLILSRFGGAAASQVNTFNGAMKQFGNTFSDIFEEFGLAIIRTPQLIGSIRGLGAQFGILAKSIAENAGAISTFVSLGITATTGLVAGLALVAKGAANIVAVGAALVKFLIDPLLEGAKAVYEIVKAIYLLGKTAGDAEAQFKKFFATLDPRNFFNQAETNKAVNDDIFDPIIFGALEVKKSSDEAASSIKKMQEQQYKNAPKVDVKALAKANEERTKVLQEFEARRKELAELGLSNIEKLERRSAETAKLINEARNFGIIKSDKERDELLVALQKETSDRMVKLKKEELERIRSETQKFATDPANAIAGAIRDGQKVSAQQGAAAAAGFTKSALQGADGAKQLVSSVIGAAADFIIPGIGGVVSEIVGVLSQGPDKVKQMITDFARSIPQIIQSLVESLPALIQALVTELPPALAKAMPTVAFGLTTSLLKNIPQIVKGFAQGLIDAAKQFVQAIIDAITGAAGSVFDGITGSGDSDSIFAGIPVLQGIGDLFGFAEGGRVPDLSKYRGDRFPARLNAGEQVLDRDLSGDLENFLRDRGRRNMPDNLMVVVKIDRSELARANLDLSRYNYRTSV